MEDRETKQRYEEDVPRSAHYLQAAMEHAYYIDDDQKLLEGLSTHLERRGKTHNGIATVCRRIEGWKMVLDSASDKGVQLLAQIRGISPPARRAPTTLPNGRRNMLNSWQRLTKESVQQIQMLMPRRQGWSSLTH